MSAPGHVEVIAARYGVPPAVLAAALTAYLDRDVPLSADEVAFLTEHGGVPVEVVTSPVARVTALVERERAIQAD